MDYFRGELNEPTPKLSYYVIILISPSFITERQHPGEGWPPVPHAGDLPGGRRDVPGDGGGLLAEPTVLLLCQ